MTKYADGATRQVALVNAEIVIAEWSLARQKECQILEGHLMPDPVHMCIAIPPKHPVAHD